MKVLACVDLSESSVKIMKEVGDFAKSCSVKLWVLHVAEPVSDFCSHNADPQIQRDVLAAEFHKEHQQLQTYADSLRLQEISTTALLIQGVTVQTILTQASNLDVDMIILGSHGRGAMYQLLVGSVSEEVIRKAECSIMIIPTHERV